ncbi:hypothetical protein MPSEU_000907500 [Mayamaea pseudoterrestris]|nr:hypothetical protein MPSEU_000907500 [Mayamaea pseudoterrestris]
MADEAVANNILRQNGQEGVITEDEENHEETIEENLSESKAEAEENAANEDDESRRSPRNDVQLAEAAPEYADNSHSAIHNSPPPVQNLQMPHVPIAPMHYSHQQPFAPHPPPHASSFLPIPPPQLLPDPAFAMHSFYEARMRDHAAAYANAAAGAAWAAAQIAQAAADYANGYGCLPPNSFAPMPPQLPGIWNLNQAATLPGMYGPPPLHPVQGLSGVDDFNPYSYTQESMMQSPIPSDHFADYQHQSYHDDTHGRKRQERPPSDNDSSSVPRVVHHPADRSSSVNHESSSKVRRRRLSLTCDSPVSSSSEANYSSKTYQSSSSKRFQHYRGGNRRQQQQHGTSHGNSQQRNSDQKLQHRSRGLSSLMGKTAVAALYEWCSKRHFQPPKFVQQQTEQALANTAGEAKVPLPPLVSRPREYVCLVFVDGVERGRGCGQSKVTARQDAAKEAFLALEPGIVFDESTNLLIGLPTKQRAPTQQSPYLRNRSASMDDELPNLAKRLAIGRDNEYTADGSVGDSKKKRLKSSQPMQHAKRTLGIFPASSTTASEEDCASVYCKAKGGANVYSVLLHAMLQIAKIPFPEYVYERAPLDNAGDKIAEQEEAMSPAFRPMRGPFLCRATLVIPPRFKEAQSDDALPVLDEPWAGHFGGKSIQTLEACACGESKREARHLASADVLALLFPECETMTEVKAAAESFRERHAEAKASKPKKPNKQTQWHSRIRERERSKSVMLARVFPGPNELLLPLALQQELASLIDNKYTLDEDSDEKGENEYDDTTRGELDQPESDPRKTSASVAIQRMNRQKQIDAMTEQALQMLNELDDEGRTISELTEDDVGRTVLRRALPGDFSRMIKLLELEGDDSLPLCESHDASTISNNDTEQLREVLPMPSVVLLLCRAIAPHEDPPLGCAVLTLGFSMQNGRILNIARIASEPHLPKERFIECLFDFANAMKCHLEVQVAGAEAMFTAQDATRIVEAYVAMGSQSVSERNQRPLVAGFNKKASIALPLQSVQEESEQSDSSAEKRSKKQATKQPSKRSRFQ